MPQVFQPGSCSRPRDRTRAAQHSTAMASRSSNTTVGVLVVLALLGLPGPASALRILGLFPLPGHSHYIMFQALMEGLVEHGHEVVSFSPFPNKVAKANWTEVDTSQGQPSLISTFSFDLLNSGPIPLPGLKLYRDMGMLHELAGSNLCRHVFKQPEFTALMDGGFGRFDLVLTEVFGSDCWAAVPYKMGLPVVSVSSAPDVSWMHDRIGSVDNPSYIGNVFSGVFGRMSLWERFTNTVSTLWINYLHRIGQDESDAVVREFFGPGVPPQRELVKNTSLILLNRHHSIHEARPVVPNLVHVGGLHIKPPPGTLSAELRKWMDDAKHGVIFFSMGSLMRASTMPVAVRSALLDAFAKLPQRVLWKYEDENLQVPPNVRIAKWLPQMDILTHPKTVLFITHGGLMGTLESLHSSVPMLGIPLFADQHNNIELYRKMGIAEHLDFHTISADSVLDKIRVTLEPRYKERSVEVAARFRDRPRAALEEAVWWVEYVARHRGAPHLRSLGADLPLYQYLLLDVVALGLAFMALAAFVVLGAIRAVVSVWCSSTATVTKPAKKKVA